MTVSNKKKLEIENLTQPTDTKKEIFQQGGKITMKEWIKSANTNALPSIKRDNTNTVRTDLITNSKPALGRDQGTISAYNKSPRERLMSGLHKLANTGTTAGDVTSMLVGAPVMSGAKLLRPDNYFKGVGSDSDIKDALLEMGGDVLNVAPLAYGAVKGGQLAKRVGGEYGTAFNEATSLYKNRYKQIYNATGDLPLTKRVPNALKGSTTAKQMPGDKTGYSYFNLTPEQTAAKMKSDTNVLPGTAHLETSLSLNSGPLYWNKSAKLVGDKKSDWTMVRTGAGQDTNMAGVNGKRIYDAIPNSIKEEQAELLAYNSLQKNWAKNDLAQGTLNKETYRRMTTDMDNNLNQALMDPLMLSELNGEGRYTEFLNNYKPNMDAGIKKVNDLTGLNFPMSKVKEAGYELPTMIGINNVKQRGKNVIKDIIGSTRDNVAINRAIKTADANQDVFSSSHLRDLKADTRFRMHEPGKVKNRMEWVKKTSADQNKTIDQLDADYGIDNFDPTADLIIDTSDPVSRFRALFADDLNGINYNPRGGLRAPSRADNYRIEAGQPQSQFRFDFNAGPAVDRYGNPINRAPSMQGNGRRRPLLPTPPSQVEAVY